MSNFYFGSPENGSDDDSDNDQSDLPFPKPLQRSSFLAQSFDPTQFLSSLTNRHQTLEDLRTELRDLSTSLNKELLDLVNDNYTDFLGLGSALRGGDEKVGEVQVGLLGFQRDVNGVMEAVRNRKEEVRKNVDERRSVKRQIRLGNQMVDVGMRLDLLEAKLMIKLGENGESKTSKEIHGKGFSEDEFGDDSESDSDALSDGEEAAGEEIEAFSPLRRFGRRVREYFYVRRSITSLTREMGDEQPYLSSLQGRVQSVKGTLLLDLGTMTKQAKDSGKGGHERVLGVIKLHDAIAGDNVGAAIPCLKELRV